MISNESAFILPILEFFELTNISAKNLDLEGCIIADAARNHVIAGSLTVLPNVQLLLARDDNSVSNGGMAVVDYVYPDIALNNGEDSVTLTCNDVMVDTVFYNVSWPWSAGISMQLDAGSFDSVTNNSSANWCASLVAYGDGDLGSPGETNVGCSF